MPYENEHSCRLNNPEKYKRFVRKNNAGKVDNKAIDLIIGYKEDGSSETQAIRYPKKTWTQNEAKKHCQEKKGKYEPAQMTNVMEFLNNNITLNNYNIRTEIHQGNKHLVVPVVMLVEGVHNGNHGPVLHLAEELSKFPEAWNGIPVPILHPEKNGYPISANCPDVIDKKIVGRIYNTQFIDNKLKAEIWIDEEKISQISPETLAYIRQKRPLEVSTGLFNEEEYTSGIWNNEEYQAIARNYRPDHLALLPGQRGACNWEKGCGVRINNKTLNQKEENKEKIKANNMENTKDNTLNNNIKDKGDITMSNNKDKGCCPNEITTLVESKTLGFNEIDREWLQTLSKEAIDKLININKTVNEAIEKAENIAQQIEVNKEEIEKDNNITKEKAIQVLKDTLSDPNQFMELLPTQIKNQMEYGLKLHQEKKQELINTISTNSNDIFSKEELQEKEITELTKLAALARPITDYSPMNLQRNNNKKEVLLPPGVRKDN